MRVASNWIKSTLLWLICLYTANAQYVQPGLCDMYCHCPPGEAVVDCNRQDKLPGVPTNIPRGVTKLYVQEGDFPSPSFLTRANMTGLEQVEYLSIIYCNLQAIESKTFLGMTKLKHLDLSRNALRRLETYTFFGLQLVKLYLQEQHNLTEFGLHLAEDVFDGLTADQINLRGNRLTSVQYSVFSKVNSLHRLILSDNRITLIDDGFSKHFNGHSYLLDLTGNPLECNCKLAWLAMMSVEWSSSLPGLNMTCVYYQSNPFGFREYTVLELRRLRADHLCPRSRIKHIEISIVDLAQRMILDCTAMSIPQNPYPVDLDHGKVSIPSLPTRTPPEVAWQYIEGGHLREVRRLPVEDKSSALAALSNASLGTLSSTVRLNISLHEEPRQYKCTARSNTKDVEEVIVTVRGPPKLSTEVAAPKNQLDPLPTAGKSKNDQVSIDSGTIRHTDLVLSEAHYMLQPQFSLVQLALAVGGTFLVTLILLFVGARCISSCHGTKIIRSPSSNASISGHDAKIVYHTGTAMRRAGDNSEKLFAPLNQNGNHAGLKDPAQTMLLPQSQLPQSYPPLFLPTVDTRTAMSPQFTHLNNIPNHFFQPLAPTQASSSSGNEELQTSLAHLVSSPLLQPNHSMRPMPTAEATLSPCLTNYRNGQPQLAYWPAIAPGSPYSVAGSHEYDVPRFAEISSYPIGVSTSTMNTRSSVANQTEAHNGFGSNMGASH